MSKQTVMIIGLGLIGSSLAVCIKKEHPDVLIYGWDNSRNTNKIAIENKVVDLLPKNFDETAQNSDIIVLAVPVNTTQYYLQKLSKIGLKKETIITDTSSTKQEIVHTAKYYNLNFIGGHPMAGSHKSGIFACDENLFENAYYIFTPIKEEQKDQMKQLENLFLGTRAKYILLDPKEHDEITGMLSHLPHIIASGLVNQAEIFKQQHPRAMQLAAGGFRDITRIASSDPQMWTDILLNNREVLLQMLTQWQKEMSQLSFWLKNKKAEQLYHFFEHAKATRDHLPSNKKGSIPAFYDLFVDVPDKPGSIAEITSLLAKSSISLTNIKILETREEIIGILQLTFKNEKDLIKAKAHIENKTNYHCRLQ